MSDRFKFRYWDIQKKEYFTCGKIDHKSGVSKCYPYRTFDWCIEQPKFILPEQCTGLKDKNGKLIYENDIIDTPNGIYRVAVDDFGLWTAIYKGNPLKDVVEWSDIVKNYAFNKENVEIVILGNIHENKELLDE